MHIKNILDVLVFIPLLPAIPVIATWFLPWERWIPKRIPKKVIGPYLFYCAFAVWYFKQSWWVVLMAGLGGIVVSVIAIFELRKARMMIQAQNWPLAEGDVLGTHQSRDADGVVKVTLTYTFKVHDERFGGCESFTFSGEDDAEVFESGCRERILRVHYRQDNPDISVLDRDG